MTHSRTGVRVCATMPGLPSPTGPMRVPRRSSTPSGMAIDAGLDDDGVGRAGQDHRRARLEVDRVRRGDQREPLVAGEGGERRGVGEERLGLGPVGGRRAGQRADDGGDGRRSGKVSRVVPAVCQSSAVRTAGERVGQPDDAAGADVVADRAARVAGLAGLQRAVDHHVDGRLAAAGEDQLACRSAGAASGPVPARPASAGSGRPPRSEARSAASRRGQVGLAVCVSAARSRLRRHQRASRPTSR